MQIGPLLATALLLALVMPVASADDVSPASVVEAINDTNLLPEDLSAPQAPGVTPEEWAEFLATIDEVIAQTHPGVGRVGPDAPVVTQLVFTGISAIDMSPLEDVVALLPADCESEKIQCSVDKVRKLLSLEYCADGLDPPVDVVTWDPTNFKFEILVAGFGTKSTCAGDNQLNQMPGNPVQVGGGHWTIIING